MATSTLRRVAQLPHHPIDELKRLWREFFQSDPPPYNKAFLVKRLAYRMQELEFGGLPPTTEARLKALAEGKQEEARKGVFANTDRPATGTRLVREWKGVEHSCTVLEDGFEYQGRRYGSLSAVANAITGTRWNGRLFWGLSKGEKR